MQINDVVEIAKLIAKFQALEISIKILLVKNQTEDDKKNNKLLGTYSLIEVDNIPYGTLLKRYAKISNNPELYNRMLALKEFRNFLAHKSLLSVSNMPQEMKAFIGVNIEQPMDYQALNKELDECLFIFNKQLSNIKAD